jgi:hypothetical protein
LTSVLLLRTEIIRQSGVPGNNFLNLNVVIIKKKIFFLIVNVNSTAVTNVEIIVRTSVDRYVRYHTLLLFASMGWVRNVVLIKCIFGSGKPKGGSGFWVEGYMG